MHGVVSTRAINRGTNRYLQMNWLKLKPSGKQLINLGEYVEHASHYQRETARSNVYMIELGNARIVSILCPKSSRDTEGRFTLWPRSRGHRFPSIRLQGPVYTTVEKSTGHEKKAFLNCGWSKMQLLTGGCLH